MRTHAAICALFVCSLGAAQAQDASPPQAAKKAQPTNAFTQGTSKCHGVMNVASDTFEGDMQTKVGIYTGNVIVTQATCKLRADKVIAEATTGSDLNRLTAVGNVVFNNTSGTAMGDNGVYDLGPKLLTLTGKVILTKGKDVMRGTRLIVDVNTMVAHVTAKGMPGNRVLSSFHPKQGEGEQDSSPPKPNSGQ